MLLFQEVSRFFCLFSGDSDTDRSTGSDASPVVIPLRGAGKEYHRTLPHIPQSPDLKSAPKARFILSWWGNEIRVWHLVNAARELFGDSGACGDLRKNRKLIAQLFVKGESNITSADISEDGTLIVASTATDVKAFQLDFTNGPQPENIKIKTVEVVGATQGATKVEISPDNRWVCWIEEGSRPRAARITANGNTYTFSQPSRLRRIDRHIPKNLLLGGLGSYDRNITQVAFSPDSKMISVADLAGFIDTWVLRVPGEERNGTSGEADDADSDASSSDSSDDEEEQNTTTEDHWIRNPKAKLIPKLGSAPVALSFASQSSGLNQDGDDDYNLMVITTLKQVLVFNPLRGALSDWSRKNTYVKLPEQLRLTRDLVKGVVWQGPRAWIYGSSFLFMLDLSQDLPDPQLGADERKGQKHGVKRKRDARNESGAGGKMDNKEALAPQQVKTLAHSSAGALEWMDVEMADGDDAKSVGASSGLEDDDDYEDEDEEEGELQRLRHQQGSNGDAESKELVPAKAGRVKWWHTRQYRPILGIVPLEGGGLQKQLEGANGVNGGVSIPPLEVALVERPSWQVDMPPRYFAGGEWER